MHSLWQHRNFLLGNFFFSVAAAGMRDTITDLGKIVRKPNGKNTPSTAIHHFYRGLKAVQRTTVRP